MSTIADFFGSLASNINQFLSFKSEKPLTEDDSVPFDATAETKLTEAEPLLEGADNFCAVLDTWGCDSYSKEDAANELRLLAQDVQYIRGYFHGQYTELCRGELKSAITDFTEGQLSAESIRSYFSQTSQETVVDQDVEWALKILSLKNPESRYSAPEIGAVRAMIHSAMNTCGAPYISI